LGLYRFPYANVHQERQRVEGRRNRVNSCLLPPGLKKRGFIHGKKEIFVPRDFRPRHSYVQIQVPKDLSMGLS